MEVAIDGRTSGNGQPSRRRSFDAATIRKMRGANNKAGGICMNEQIQPRETRRQRDSQAAPDGITGKWTSRHHMAIWTATKCRGSPPASLPATRLCPSRLRCLSPWGSQPLLDHDDDLTLLRGTPQARLPAE